jgi:hypothetical protein
LSLSTLQSTSSPKMRPILTLLRLNLCLWIVEYWIQLLSDGLVCNALVTNYEERREAVPPIVWLHQHVGKSIVMDAPMNPTRFQRQGGTRTSWRLKKPSRFEGLGAMSPLMIRDQKSYPNIQSVQWKLRVPMISKIYSIITT